jgi:hypothetical protein
MDSLILQTAIGLIFVFATFSWLASVLTEVASRFIGLRGEYLLRGIRSLVDGKSTFELGWRDLLRRKTQEPKPGEEDAMVSRVVRQPMIALTATDGTVSPDAGNAKLSVRDRRNVPSYVTGKSFARAFFGVLVPDASGNTTMTEVQDQVRALPDGDLKKSLLLLLATTGHSIDEFRQGLEEWYDDHMARVSGWYKRHVRWITIGFGTLLVLAFNLSAVEITRSLYTDEAMRTSVVTQATDAAQCQGKEPAQCLHDLRNEIGNLRASGLPIGWGTVTECTDASVKCTWLERRGLADPDEGAGSDVLFFLTVFAGWAFDGAGDPARGAVMVRRPVPLGEPPLDRPEAR